jgi:myo-inositol 2-dehydrogenase / D-chiro-inositol 1-dehydrogenase
MAFKICIVGCGGMAVNGHGPMLKKYAAMHQNVELAACCDISMERAQSFAAVFGFAEAYADMGDMLDAVKPDGVVLVVPIGLTARLALEILKRHIPLLTEKPPGMTPEEGKAIVAAAKSAGVPVSAAFNRRTMPLVEALVREIDAVGGDIDSVEIEMCRLCRTDSDFSTTAIHDVDLARYICRSDYSHANLAYRVHEPYAPAADINVQAVMESGAFVNLGFYPMCGSVSEKVSVRMHNHLIRAELPIYNSADVPGKIVHIKENNVLTRITGKACCDPAEANGFLGEHSSFFDAVRDGGIPRHSVEGSLQSLEVACSIRNRESSYHKWQA